MITAIRSVIGYVKSRVTISRQRLGIKKRMETEPVSDIPVVVILGETGVGKTKLAVELCSRFEGEVISADSMQIYEGLDIITNKVTPNEAGGIPHHMISILSPLASNFNVQVFQSRALKTMEEMWTNRRAVPVVVGGTNYYIEALLWNRLVCPDKDAVVPAEGDPEEGDPAVDHSFTRSIPFDASSMTDEQLHEQLTRVDPATAKRTHPNNRRRVIRSIQIYYQTGRRHSDWLDDQHSATGANALAGTARFRRLCVIRLTADKNVLKERLTRRVDEMVDRGLREEISAFYDRYSHECRQKYGVDITTKGILQAIGLKEFENYLKLPPQERLSDAAGSSAFNEGVEKLKLVTIRYARKQRQWIQNRFRLLAARDAVPIYCLDTSDVAQWTANVSIPAQDVLRAFLDGRAPEGVSEVPAAAAVKERIVENQFCQVCQRLIPGLQWNDHLSSKGHRALSKRQ